jgi:glycerol uptake facilitator-like aquaporin
VVLLCVRRMVARVCLSWLAARTHALLLLLLLMMMMMMMTIARGVNINRALSRRLGWRLAQEMSGLPSLCCSR